MYQFTINSNEAGQRFDKYLHKLLPKAPASFFYKMLRKKHGHAHIAEGLCHDLQRNGLAGAGGAGDQAVAIGHGGLQIDGRLSRRQPDLMLLL